MASDVGSMSMTYVTILSGLTCREWRRRGSLFCLKVHESGFCVGVGFSGWWEFRICILRRRWIPGSGLKVHFASALYFPGGGLKVHFASALDFPGGDLKIHFASTLD